MRTPFLRSCIETIPLVGLVAACASGSATPTPGASPSSAAEQQATGAARALVASLQPTNNAGNRIVGTVKLTPNGPSQYRVEIQIRNGGGPQNKFPWVIRPGACGDDGRDVLGNELDYRVLETSADGSARLIAPLRLRIPEGTFHVNVMKGVSSMDRETVVSCGVLSAS